jgi:hypothetical protein
MSGLRHRVGEGGAVVVTLFVCRTRRDIALIWWLHKRIKPAVRAHASGFLDVRLIIDWRRRLVRSVSLWTDPAHLYGMGKVSEHVAASRIPAVRGIETSCAIYTYEGQCMPLMFGATPGEKPSPLAADIPGHPPAPSVPRPVPSEQTPRKGELRVRPER